MTIQENEVMHPVVDDEPDAPDIQDKRVRTRRVMMTPARARKLLAKNATNRPLSPRDAAKLARIMLTKKWVYNGEAIKVSESGQLLDGQHRLNACVAADAPFETLVIEGLPDAVFATLDQGRRRSGGDVLYMRGIKRHNVVASACISLYRLVKNRPIYGSIDQIPAYGVDDILGRHPSLQDAVEFCVGLSSRGDPGIVGAGLLASYYYAVGNIMRQPEAAVSLAEGLVVGAGLEENDPLLRFRNKVVDTRRRSNVMQGQVKMALLTKVVGLHLAGDTIKRQLTPPNTGETFWSLIHGLQQAVSDMPKDMRFDDLDY